MKILFKYLAWFLFSCANGYVTGFDDIHPEKLLNYQKIVDDYYQINGYIRPIEAYRTTADHPIYYNTTKNKMLTQTLLRESSQLLHTYRRDDIYEMNVWSWGYDFSLIGSRNTPPSCLSQMSTAARTMQSQLVALTAALYNSTSSEDNHEALSAFVDRTMWLGVSALILPVLNSAKDDICPSFESTDDIPSRKFSGLWSSPENVWEVTVPRMNLQRSISHRQLRGDYGVDFMLLQNVGALQHLARLAYQIVPKDDAEDDDEDDNFDATKQELIQILSQERFSDISNLHFVPICQRNAPGAFFAYTSDTIIVSFRGSARGFDAYLNVNCQGCHRVDDNGSRVTIHGGFMLGYCCIEQRLLKLFDDAIKFMRRSRKKLNRIYVVGHSLGGALATIASFDFFSHMLNKLMRFEDNRKVLKSVENVRSRFFAFVVGAPPVGSHDFKEAFDLLNINLFRYESETDLVTKAVDFLEWVTMSGDKYKFRDFLSDQRQARMKRSQAIIAFLMFKLGHFAYKGLKWLVDTTYVHVGTKLDMSIFGATGHFDTSCSSFSGFACFLKKSHSTPSYYHDFASVFMFQSGPPIIEQYLFPRDNFRIFSYFTNAYCVPRTRKSRLGLNLTRIICDGTKEDANDNLFSFYRTGQDQLRSIDSAIITFSTDLSLVLSKYVPYSRINCFSEICLHKSNCGYEIYGDWYITEIGSKNSVRNNAVVQLRPIEEENGEKVFKKGSIRNDLVVLDGEMKANISIVSHDQKFLEATSDRMYFNPIKIVNATDLSASRSAFRIEKVDAMPHYDNWTEIYYTILRNYVFKIQAVHSKLALDVPGGKQTHELKIQQYKQNASKNQRWTCNFIGKYCQLKNRASEKCLTTENQDRYLVQTRCDSGDPHQLFLWEPAQQRSFYMKSHYNETECLEVENASMRFKSFIKVSPCSSQEHQRYQILVRGRRPV